MSRRSVGAPPGDYTGDYCGARRCRRYRHCKRATGDAWISDVITTMEGYDSILLVQHRYHTSQHPVVKTLKQKGHEVHFLSLDRTGIETYDALSPDLIKKSAIFTIIATLVATVGLGTLREKYAWSVSFWYLTYLRRTDPDLIILKKYYSKPISTIILARLLGIEVLFNDQTPVYGDAESYTKRKVASIVYYVLFSFCSLFTGQRRHHQAEGDAKGALFTVLYRPYRRSGGPNIRGRWGLPADYDRHLYRAEKPVGRVTERRETA